MKNLRKRVGRFLLMFAMLFAGILLPQNTKAVWAADGSMTVHFLDVGQGLSVLVESEGQTLLYDGGPRSASSFVVSYLQERQISEIDYLISSHYDEDHVSGLIGCLNAFDVANVIGADYVHDSSLYDSFMDGSRSGYPRRRSTIQPDYLFRTVLYGCFYDAQLCFPWLRRYENSAVGQYCHEYRQCNF